ncbi:hypothetical protein AYR62_10995 [Secundilactobacillus paracollinoides]|uniref:hypothetical protein n=1 Tax=Secundilactobacillus paracollinoides TaxID=240427 RepID=UPI00081A4E0D|nr:hypothetical protein [Secundilactobacillus paracollinoides]ANZ64560.1 hypothetical protein AYR62_10995 [Secundilactobacillus paracollinoides]
MKKSVLIKGFIAAVATLGIGLGSTALAQPQTAQASTKFSKSELQGPTGYFKSDKAGTRSTGLKSKSAMAATFALL